MQLVHKCSEALTLVDPLREALAAVALRQLEPTEGCAPQDLGQLCEMCDLLCRTLVDLKEHLPEPLCEQHMEQEPEVVIAERSGALSKASSTSHEGILPSSSSLVSLALADDVNDPRAIKPSQSDNIMGQHSSSLAGPNSVEKVRELLRSSVNELDELEQHVPAILPGPMKSRRAIGHARERCSNLKEASSDDASSPLLLSSDISRIGTIWEGKDDSQEDIESSV